MQSIAQNTFLEKLFTITFGYLIFWAASIMLIFFISLNITPILLPTITLIYYVTITWLHIRIKNWRALCAIAGSIIIIAAMYFIATNYFSKTFDTSWDGQGYHSSGVIQLAAGWNPIYQTMPIDIPEGGILVNGYPKIIWALESSIYALTSSLNSAKVLNLFVFVLSAIASVVTLQRLKFNIVLSIIITFAITTEFPVFMQMYTFMQDGLSYGLMVILLCTTVGFFARPSTGMQSVTFFGTLALLVGSKFSNLPFVAAILFVMYLCNKLTVMKFFESSTSKNLAVAFFVLSLFFTFGTNLFRYNDPFYPINTTSMLGANQKDNTPKNIIGRPKPVLLFYGIFGKTQNAKVGGDSPQNTTTLITTLWPNPADYTTASHIFNNRTGSFGALSGAIYTATFALFVATILLTSSSRKKYWLAGLCFLIMLAAHAQPTPNLLRSNLPILALPMFVLVFCLYFYKKHLIIVPLCLVLLILQLANNFKYLEAIHTVRQEEQNVILAQLAEMKQLQNNIKFSNFYSNKIRLQENDVSFTEAPINKQTCNYIRYLKYAYGTTVFCNGENIL